MKEYEYGVYLEEDLVAANMTYEVASILVKGLFEHYQEESDLLISIMRMDKVCDEDD